RRFPGPCSFPVAGSRSPPGNASAARRRSREPARSLPCPPRAGADSPPPTGSGPASLRLGSLPDLPHMNKVSAAPAGLVWIMSMNEDQPGHAPREFVSLEVGTKSKGKGVSVLNPARGDEGSL